MAKALYGAGIPDLHGRLQGYTFQKSLYGPQVNLTRWGTIRRTIPTNRTRAAFLYLSSHWRTLPQDARDAWEIYGAPELSGFNSYMKENLKIVIAGGAMTSYPPAGPGTPTFTFQSMVWTFTSNGEIDQLIVNIKSSYPYPAANLGMKTWLAPGPERYSNVQKADRVSEAPDFVIVNGSNIELRYNWSAAKTMIQTIPGWEQDIWFQPMDKSTNQPLGPEIHSIAFMNAMNAVKNPNLVINWDAVNKKFHISGAVKFATNPGVNSIYVWGYKGTSSGVVAQWPGTAMSFEDKEHPFQFFGSYSFTMDIPFTSVPAPGFAYFKLYYTIVNNPYPITIPIYHSQYNPL